MKSFFSIIILYISALVLLHVNAQGSVPVPPEQDSFYHPQPGFARKPNGSILKTRKLEAGTVSSIFSNPQNLEAAYQILFKTSDGLDKSTVSVTTVLVPHNADLTKVVSYQMSGDYTWNQCSPSYGLRTGATNKAFVTQAELLIVDSMMDYGYVGLITDYEGIDSLYGVQQMSGHAVLDAIRALQASDLVPPNAKYQLYGYSGGAIAAGWAVQIQPSYAPELDNIIIGSVMGGTEVRLDKMVDLVNETPHTGIIATTFMGLSRQYSEFAQTFNQSVKPEYMDLFYDFVNHNCFPQINQEFAYKDINSYFKTPGGFTNLPLPQELATQNNIGNQDTPRVPIFMFHAQNDNLARLEDVTELYEKWCSQGAKIELLIDSSASHYSFVLTGASDAINFVRRQFEGRPRNQDSCSQRTTVTSLSNPESATTLGTNIISQMRGLLGAPIGPLS